MSHQNPWDTGSCPPAYCRCPPVHQAHIEDARIQLEQEENFLEHQGCIVKGTVNLISGGDISTAILRQAGCGTFHPLSSVPAGRGLVKGLLLISGSAE